MPYVAPNTAPSPAKASDTQWQEVLEKPEKLRGLIGELIKTYNFHRARAGFEERPQTSGFKSCLKSWLMLGSGYDPAVMKNKDAVKADALLAQIKHLESQYIPLAVAEAVGRARQEQTEALNWGYALMASRLITEAHLPVLLLSGLVANGLIPSGMGRLLGWACPDGAAGSSTGSSFAPITSFLQGIDTRIGNVGFPGASAAALPARKPQDWSPAAQVTPAPSKSLEGEPDLPPSLKHQLFERIEHLYNETTAENLLSPEAFIEHSIRQLIDRSDATVEAKQSLGPNSTITVEFKEARPLFPSTLLRAYELWFPSAPETRQFTLREVIVGEHKRALSDKQIVQTTWPPGFTTQLIEAVSQANLQSAFTERITQLLGNPDIEALHKVVMRKQLDEGLRSFASQRRTSSASKKLVQAALAGNATWQRVVFKGESTAALDNAVFLPADGKSISGRGGLLVFFGEQQRIFELPANFDARRRVIENSPLLHELVRQHIPLYEQLRDGNQNVRYRHTRIRNSIQTYLVEPLHFEASADIEQDLYNLYFKRVLSDIDTLVSTQAERLTDALLEAGGHLLQLLSMLITLPLGPAATAATLKVRLFASFLLGLGSSATDATRATLADRPDVAEQRRTEAVIGVLSELAGPLGEKLLGKPLSAAAKSKLGKQAARRLKKLSRPAAKVRPTKGRARHEAARLTRQLAKGPDTAQEMAKASAVYHMKFIAPHDVAIYRGYVFRGDMRPTDQIFKEGFTLRTSAEEIQKDIHKVTGVKGGFGGGHDALDPDGKGISTSAFYNSNNVGAFTYGGAKGGHTYVIDARKLDGYHLYFNRETAMHPGIDPTATAPLEINYGTDIPASAVLGAYDRNGKFIANQDAIHTSARVTLRREGLAAIRATAANTAGKSLKGTVIQE